MIYDHNSYRSYLKTVLVEKSQKNPGFSMRAFAQHLGLSHSTLSEVMSGRKNLSSESAHRISARLKLKVKEAEFFCLLVEHERARNLDLKSEIFRRANSLRGKKHVVTLDREAFSQIADWYHMVIPLLGELQDFTFNVPNVAKTLGITLTQATEAVNQLIVLGAISLRADGTLQAEKRSLFFESLNGNAALRKFNLQMLDEAIRSVKTQIYPERFGGTETFSFDPELIPAARELIERFFNSMVDLAAQGKKKTKVYHLNLQFFNLMDRGNL